MTAGLVLVHGGATTARQWDLVVAALRSPVLAADVPGRGSRPADLGALRLPAACDSVAADARTLDVDQLVLVAHSSGGLMIPGLVERLGSAVAHVVLLAASVTSDGGCGLEAMKPAHAERLRNQWAETDVSGVPALTPADPPPAASLHRAWGGEVTDEQISFIIDPVRWVTDTTAFYLEPLDWKRVRDLPGTYLMTMQDRAVPPDLQTRMAAHLPDWPVVPLPAGHVAAVTMPTTLADLLDGVVGQVERNAMASTS
jgi:pimeloyl-ACP methyl ester carboxylesterase